MAPCALCSLAEATIFIAEVIFRVLLTEFILVFTSFSEAIVFLNYKYCLATIAAVSSIALVTLSSITPVLNTSNTSS